VPPRRPAPAARGAARRPLTADDLSAIPVPAHHLATGTAPGIRR